MTVKSRLLISHLIMFIVPIFMAVIVAAVMLAGALILSRGNNYLYLENISKCTRAAEISCHIFFHGNLEHPENSAGRWLISLLSPKQNLILFTKGKDPIYTYGNKDYLAQLSRIPPDSDWEERENGRTGTYIRAEDESFYYARKMTRKDTPYYSTSSPIMSTGRTIRAMKRWSICLKPPCGASEASFCSSSF